jgi:hypothetical protein
MHAHARRLSLVLVGERMHVSSEGTLRACSHLHIHTMKLLQVIPKVYLLCMLPVHLIV